MKLIIQIPCWNEAEQLPTTVAALPRTVAGFDVVEYLVIDDGCSDETAKLARDAGVHHVVPLQTHQGLARAFIAGIEACVAQGADVIINTDADNQYDASNIPHLVAPILARQADLVIGSRPISTNPHFSRVKRWLQCLGSAVVRFLSGVPVRDAPCGFRAMTRATALRVQVFTGFSYTIETLVQAGANRWRVVNVPIRVNAPTRPSRLFRSNLGYVWRSGWALLMALLIYRGRDILASISLLMVMMAICMPEMMGSWLQAALICGIGAMVAFLTQINRKLLEESCGRLRELGQR
jgi:glycosyltransferase involved in cell wall biosynthesis